MPGGRFDSSKTRVAPVFDALAARTDDWVRQLMELVAGSDAARRVPRELDLTCRAGYWGSNERGLRPPSSLLSWMVRNPHRLRHRESPIPKRAALLAGDAEALTEALTLIEAGPPERAWFVFEGTTYPDAFIETKDALIVVEGKRTERGPTLSTQWLDGRHQIWRHIDAAWDRRGTKQVFGFFAVEASPSSEAVPVAWQEAARTSVLPEALASSLPHRGGEERAALAACFLGVTTWQTICRRFGLPGQVLREEC